MVRFAVLIVCLSALLLGRADGGFARLPQLGGGCEPVRVGVGSRHLEALLCRATTRTGRRAAAVVLHGCAGPGSIDERVAKGLPAAGITTLYVDYFDLTPPRPRREYCNSGTAVSNALPTWQRIVVVAAATLRHSPRVHALHVGVVGYSLGAGLGLIAAEYGDRPLAGAPIVKSRFDAVAAFSAGAFQPVVSHAASLPPTLVLSGGKHDLVPTASSVALYRAVRDAGVPSKLYVYPGGNHLWLGHQGRAGFVQTRRFLRRYLLGVRH